MSAYILYFEIPKRTERKQYIKNYIAPQIIAGSSIPLVPRIIDGGTIPMSYLGKDLTGYFIVDCQCSTNFYKPGFSNIKSTLFNFIFERLQLNVYFSFLYCFIMHDSEWPKKILIPPPCVKIPLKSLEDGIFNKNSGSGLYEIITEKLEEVKKYSKHTRGKL